MITTAHFPFLIPLSISNWLQIVKESNAKLSLVGYALANH